MAAVTSPVNWPIAITPSTASPRQQHEFGGIGEFSKFVKIERNFCDGVAS